MEELTWAEFKSFISARSLLLQWTEDDDRYYLSAFDGPVARKCWIHKTAETDATALTEFEASYKAGGNQKIDQRDADGTQFSRARVTTPGWHYGPRCMSFTTAKRASLHNRKHDGPLIASGTDYGDATVKFYDAAGVEMTQGGDDDATFQAALTVGCVRTELMWTPTVARDVLGGIFKLQNVPAGETYAWFVAAPHIPEAYGGSVAYVGGGVPMHILEKEIVHFDGRGVKRINVDGTYYSHRFGLIIKHQVGDQIGVGIIFEDFVA
jgi:hypothetical protein